MEFPKWHFRAFYGPEMVTLYNEVYIQNDHITPSKCCHISPLQIMHLEFPVSIFGNGSKAVTRTGLQISGKFCLPRPSAFARPCFRGLVACETIFYLTIAVWSIIFVGLGQPSALAL